MIHYQLRCDAAHEFDGWFANSEGFESQARRGLIACPVCADTNITRALMTPGIPRKAEKTTSPSLRCRPRSIPRRAGRSPMPCAPRCSGCAKRSRAIATMSAPILPRRRAGFTMARPSGAGFMAKAPRRKRRPLPKRASTSRGSPGCGVPIARKKRKETLLFVNKK